MGKILGAYLMPHPPIILKEIGKGEEKKVKKTMKAMMKVAMDIKAKQPKTIIIITPHGPVFSDGIAISIKNQLMGNMDQFGAKEIKFIKDNNQNLVNRIITYSNKKNIVCAMVNDEFAEEYNISAELDHGTMVPLYFVDKEYIHYRLVHITYGLLSREDLYSFGKSIQEAVNDSEEEVVVIASGDLSHRLKEDGPYGYNPAGPKFDSSLLDLLSQNRVEDILQIDKELAEDAGECGLRSIDIMLGACDGYEINVDILSYEDNLGVGYGVGKIDILDKDENRQLVKKLYENRKTRINKIREKEDEYVRLARESLEEFINNNRKIQIPYNISDNLLNKKAGVFVSLKKHGDLRGCIGTIEATTENIAAEIIENAIKAGTKDPRFYPVDKDEINTLEYTVDILMEPEVIKSLDELDVHRYGVIVSSGNRNGLLLPNIDGVNSVEEQVSIALRKADIEPNEGYNIQRFEVIRHK